MHAESLTDPFDVYSDAGARLASDGRTSYGFGFGFGFGFDLGVPRGGSAEARLRLSRRCVTFTTDTKLTPARC